MKLWIGAEMDSEVADLWRPARRAVESAINAQIGTQDYELPVDSWDCIGIIRDDQVFSERIAFSRKKRDMDFRLRIAHGLFMSASAIERERMIFDMLQRSLTLLRVKAGDAVGFERLSSDLDIVAKSKGWL